jgi:hypothetical protein
VTVGRREVSQGKWVVMDVVEPCFGSWRGVTVDNFFMSAALAEEFLKKGITITVMVAPTKKEFFPHSRQEEYRSIFG